MMTRLATLAIVMAGFATAGAVESAEPEKVDARALISRMSAEIAGLDSFVVSGDAHTDARLDEGLLVEHSADVIMKVRRPGEMRLARWDSETTKEIIFRSGVLTVFDAPLLDFVARDVSDHLLREAREVRYLGTSLIRGTRYDHVSIREATVDVQIWIAAEGRPLPGKMTIRSKWEAGAPRFVAFLEWDTSPDLPNDAFVFSAPEGASRVDFDLELE